MRPSARSSTIPPRPPHLPPRCHAVRDGIPGQTLALFGWQLGDTVGHAPANGDLFKNRLVSEAEFEAFHGFSTFLAPDMVNSPG
jgi:hypothetical protein